MANNKQMNNYWLGIAQFIIHELAPANTVFAEQIKENEVIIRNDAFEESESIVFEINTEKISFDEFSDLMHDHINYIVD
jgi:D-ribose pyranose/furanose isomerase RbsD